ncbi:hypothetical protein MMC24_000939 [Lignoscripta atroalba]|nr:hypothetical protein [Lignoscripta atroalba]
MSSHHTPGLTLLRLPREIRGIVFNYLLSSAYNRRPYIKHNDNTLPRLSYNIHTNIFLVNRQLYAEALKALQANQFILVRSNLISLAGILSGLGTPMASTSEALCGINSRLVSMSVGLWSSSVHRHGIGAPFPKNEQGLPCSFLLTATELPLLRRGLHEANIILPMFLSDMALYCHIHAHQTTVSVEKNFLEPLKPLPGWHQAAIQGPVTPQYYLDFRQQMTKEITIDDVFDAAFLIKDLAHEAAQSEEWAAVSYYGNPIEALLKIGQENHPDIFADMPQEYYPKGQALLVDASLVKSLVMIKQDRCQDALDRLESFLHYSTGQLSSHEKARAFHLLGLAYLGVRMIEEALRAFKAGLDVVPENEALVKDYHRTKAKAEFAEAREAAKRGDSVDRADGAMGVVAGVGALDMEGNLPEAENTVDGVDSVSQGSQAEALTVSRHVPVIDIAR